MELGTYKSSHHLVLNFRNLLLRQYHEPTCRRLRNTSECKHRRCVSQLCASHSTASCLNARVQSLNLFNMNPYA